MGVNFPAVMRTIGTEIGVPASAFGGAVPGAGRTIQGTSAPAAPPSLVSAAAPAVTQAASSGATPGAAGLVASNTAGRSLLG